MTQPPRLSRRHVLAMGAGLALSAPLLPALAQSFPTRPLRLVVNFAPGSTPDIVARAVGQQISQSLGVCYCNTHAWI